MTWRQSVPPFPDRNRVPSMPSRRLRRYEWRPFFDAYSAGMTRQKRVFYAEIRVRASDQVPQLQTRWLPLHGITYDPGNDLLQVAVDRLGHLIYQPRSIVVDEDAQGLVRVNVRRADGTEEVVELR